MRILICDDMFAAVIETVKRMLPGDDVRFCRQDQVTAEASRAEVLIPTMVRITADIMDSAPDLRLIQQFGVGLEGVDIEAATAKGILVANVPGHKAPVHSECTAEGGVFLLMACARLFKESQRELIRGGWGRPSGEALVDRTALIIGLGAVGRALARRLIALGMKVMATEPAPVSSLVEKLGLSRMMGPDGLYEMLPLADFVISTVTLTPETQGMLNHSVFKKMKPSAYLINISRGPIVHEDDLLSAVNSGDIRGAGLDVLVKEPPPKDHPLLHHDRVVVTPHTAGATRQSFDALGRAVADNIEHLRRGEPLENTVNAKVGQ